MASEQDSVWKEILDSYFQEFIAVKVISKQFSVVGNLLLAGSLNEFTDN